MTDNQRQDAITEARRVADALPKIRASELQPRCASCGEGTLRHHHFYRVRLEHSVVDPRGIQQAQGEHAAMGALAGILGTDPRVAVTMGTRTVTVCGECGVMVPTLIGLLMDETMDGAHRDSDLADDMDLPDVDPVASQVGEALHGGMSDDVLGLEPDTSDVSGGAMMGLFSEAAHIGDHDGAVRVPIVSSEATEPPKDDI